ncbi:hypothetical protein Tcan_01610, partial [Toxocara canis]
MQCDSGTEEPLSIFEFMTHFTISSRMSAGADGPENWSKIEMQKYSPQLGGFIFCAVLMGRCSVQHFTTHTVSLLGVSQIDLLELFCAYWLHPPQGTPVFYLPRVLSVCEQMASLTKDFKQWLLLAKQKIMNRL